MVTEEKLKDLPKKSGVYIMRDKNREIIYIGKAVVLKNRVRQYFNNSPKATKVQSMVDNVDDFEYIITLTEKDALSLEANLIKKYKPKYNILLKDDKSSPYIKINMKEKFPCMEITRKVKKDGARYFGPYFNGIYAKDIADIVTSAYHVRTCPKGFNSTKRECLNYHIGLCLAPCVGRVSQDEYAESVSKAIRFLSGREDTAERLITQRMETAVQNEDFERAIIYRNQMEMLKRLRMRNLSDLGAETDIDSISLVSDGTRSAVSVVLVRGGKMMGAKNFSIDDASLSDEDALSSFISMYYGENKLVPQMICLDTEFDVAALNEYLNTLSKNKTEIVFPKIGTKRRLVEMAEKNAADYLEKSVERHERDLNMTSRAADELKEILGLASCRRMECYDISNISGVDKVASGVVFINGQMNRKDYRRYKIKTVEGSNDFASLAEVMKRRLGRAKAGDEKFTDLPDLIVIDGGKGQLSSAYAAMKEAGFDLNMISLAERDEEVFTLASPEPLRLSKRSAPLKLLQRIRDEAHRFAITYHRNLRSKRYNSSLDEIHGVGKVKRKILLNRFERIEEIQNADVETLAAVEGIDRRTAQAVYDFYRARERAREE